MSEGDRYQEHWRAAAPPTRPGELAQPPQPAQPAIWPKVIGIVAIIFGALGILGGLWQMIFALFIERFISSMEKVSGGAESFEVIILWKSWLVTAGIVSTVLAILLTVAGIRLIRRRSEARPLYLMWAVLKVMAVTAMAVLNFSIQQDQLQSQMFGDGASAVAMPVNPMVLTAIGLVWGWALPIFMIVWFSLPTYKAQIEQWP